MLFVTVFSFNVILDYYFLKFYLLKLEFSSFSKVIIETLKYLTIIHAF